MDEFDFYIIKTVTATRVDTSATMNTFPLPNMLGLLFAVAVGLMLARGLLTVQDGKAFAVAAGTVSVTARTPAVTRSLASVDATAPWKVICLTLDWCFLLLVISSYDLVPSHDADREFCSPKIEHEAVSRYCCLLLEYEAR